MTIGERIKKRRIEIGMSVDDLATIIGKNRATIYRYESADIEKLPITILEPLAKALRTTPAELMGWSKEEKPLSNDFALSESEKKLVIAYRARPEMQAAVDKLLGIDEEFYITKIAARNGDNGVVGLTLDQINGIINAPDVPKDL